MGVVALVIVLSYPGYKRCGLMEKAQTLRADLQEIDLAVAASAKELKAPPGALLDFSQYRQHLRPHAAAAKAGLDPFGQAYGPQRVGAKPHPSEAAATALQATVPAGFWGQWAP